MRMRPALSILVARQRRAAAYRHVTENIPVQRAAVEEAFMAAQRDQDQAVNISPLGLEGTLGLPGMRPKGVVIFAHGSGSSRFSPRNNYVARALRQAGLATYSSIS
jgi:hypothetical protein